MKVKVDIYNPSATAKRILSNNKVGKFTAQTWERYFAKLAPKGNGNMIQNTTIKPFEVTYNSPSAHYLWNGKLMVSPSGSSWAKLGETKHYVNQNLVFSKEMNPNACSHWEEQTARVYKKQIAGEVSKFIERGI